MTLRILLILFFIVISTTLSAQLTDLARMEYTYFPQRDSDNSFKRFRTFVNLPIKLNSKGTYLVPGLEYRNVRFDYEDPSIFDSTNLNDFHSIRATIGYTFKMSNDWRFAAKTGFFLASNFEGDGVTSDDFLFSGSIFFIKDQMDESPKAPWRLIVGLQYATTAGRPFPLPFINYFKKFHPSWTYSLGVPKTNIKYLLNEKNILQGFATLDGFYANIQRNRNIPDSIALDANVASNISMTVALAGIGYEHCFTKHLVFYIYGGYTLMNDIRLRSEDQENVFTINDQNSVYGRTGIKFKI